MWVALLIACLIIGPQLYAIWVWRGLWRWLAAAPLLVMAADLVLILVQTAFDPTSHNLWPLELAMIGAAGLALVGALWLARLVMSRATSV
jgi:hypothetical protein